MKALLLKSPAPIEGLPLEIADVPVPAPSPGQVLLQVLACGLCHTDLHTIEGELLLPRLPLIPGHQIVGVVEKVGKDVTELAHGARVGVGWLNWACGECAYCRSDRENLCPGARFTGYHVDGGYAQYALAPSEFVYSIPGGFSPWEAAPLLCGGVIGYRAFRLSEASPGGVLGLYGFGASAHIVIQVALHLGCRVFVFTRGETHQALARRMGAEWVGQAQAKPSEKLDSAIIFAPAGELVPLALGALKPGGTLALAGITMSVVPQMSYDLIYGERTVRSVANSTRRDAQELLFLASAIPVKTAVEVFPMEEANHALGLLKHGRINGAAVLRIGED